MFFDLGGPISRATNAGLDWLLVTYGDAFEAASNKLLWVLLLIEQALRALHPAALLALVFALAWAGSRRLGVALAMATTLYLVGCLGLWEQAMQTIAIIVVAV